jgi:hemoglobin/transferrin/lactoferrin receptor protein
MKRKSSPLILTTAFILALLLTGGTEAAQSTGQTASNDKPAQAEKGSGQQKKEKKKKPAKGKENNTPVIHEEITVTATHAKTTVFNTPSPISVVNEQSIKEKSPNNVSELMPEIPGMDIVGVGANQSRPVIRGLRWQRILLLSDGIRMSNSRRSQDFGEIPALVDIAGVERVEVIRGPASVLYGSEAIGGVINIITSVPDYSQNGLHLGGKVGYRYSSADEQNKGFADISGNFNNFGFMLNGSFRNSRDYQAPAGSFGNITLTKNTSVLDSGVKDYSLNLFLGYRLATDNNITFKYEKYNARDAGFGYVDPAVYAPGDPTIRLLYPNQDLNRFTLKFENRALHSFLANGISLTGYYVQNSRLFDTNITIPFFPGAGLGIQSRNDTNVKTYGTRIELTKVILRAHILSYGLDFYQDNSENTDSNTTTMFGFGPPQTTTNGTPNIPNAYIRYLGVFLQDQWLVFGRTSLVLGIRYQDVQAQTKATPGLSDPIVHSNDGTLAGAANLITGVTDNLNLVFSAGRGFRSPNLTERFFNGVTPDGSGFQIRTPRLKPETNLNLEVGFRYRLSGFYLESSYFHNTVYDGIAVIPTGRFSDSLPEYKNVNIDRLRFQGVEILGQYDFNFGVTLGANYSYLKSKNLSNPELPYTDTFGSRLNLNLRYALPEGHFWIEYYARLSGARKDVNLGVNPIGRIIPGFAVHTLRFGTTLFKKSAFPQQIAVIFGNLTNTLYTEVSNASFFRPAPKRHVVLNWTASF